MEIIDVIYSDGTIGQQVVIASNGGFTAMPKSVYDEMIANQPALQPKIRGNQCVFIQWHCHTHR